MGGEGKVFLGLNIPAILVLVHYHCDFIETKCIPILIPDIESGALIKAVSGTEQGNLSPANCML